MTQMTADESRRYAETLVLPRLLALAGLVGALRPIEQPWRDGNRTDPIVRALDTVGGVDFWLERPDLRLAIASRVQWHKNDGHHRKSFTVRLDIGGPPTEAHKRVAAIENGGLLPEWTAQGYVESGGALHHAGIIRTRELFAAFLEASRNPRFTTWTNPDDGHVFWCGFWATLERYGHADSLRTVEPATAEPAQLSLVTDQVAPELTPHGTPAPFDDDRWER